MQMNIPLRHGWHLNDFFQVWFNIVLVRYTSGFLDFSVSLKILITYQRWKTHTHTPSTLTILLSTYYHNYYHVILLYAWIQLFLGYKTFQASLRYEVWYNVDYLLHLFVHKEKNYILPKLFFSWHLENTAQGNQSEQVIL